MKAKKHTKLYEWQEKNKRNKQACPKCGRIEEMTVEHIIPVRLMLELGLDEEAKNDEENFELLCYRCNRFKGGRIELAHPKTKELLQKYINLL